MRARKFLIGAAAIAKQDRQGPAQQAPSAQEQQGPGGYEWDCPWKDGQGQQKTEV